MIKYITKPTLHITLIATMASTAVIAQTTNNGLIKSEGTNLSIGEGASTNNNGTYSTAIGNGSNTNGHSALALGTQASASGNNTVVVK